MAELGHAIGIDPDYALAFIAAAFLRYDESQLDYYETITNNMPGRVLQKHGIVTKQASGYSLAPHVSALSQVAGTTVR